MLNVLELQAQLANGWLRMAETGMRAMSEACLKMSQDATSAMMGSQAAFATAGTPLPSLAPWPMMMPQWRAPNPFDITAMSAPGAWQAFWPTPQPWNPVNAFANPWSPMGLAAFGFFPQPKPLVHQLADIAFASYRTAGGHAMAVLGRPMVALPGLTSPPWPGLPGTDFWRKLAS
ncbi:MAG: hypothetical protein R3D68_20730 [Hyphomicrobiaceae bacterium]